MINYSYEFYIKNNCIPIGYNEVVGCYIFGQSTVDFLLDAIDSLKQEIDLQKKISKENFDSYVRCSRKYADLLLKDDKHKN